MNFKKIPGQKIKKYGDLINKEKPTISIVTPYYNGGKTIDETFNSVMNQTYPYFEWIIVNDGSKDEESNKKIKEVVKRDSRLKYFEKENGGPAQARDFGIKKCSKDTKYVFFLDADDLIDPTMLECLYWTLETHPDASFAYTALINFGDEEYLWEKYLTIEQEKEENLINITSLVRKADLLEVGCFGIKEKAMYEDWNLWLKLLAAGKKPLRVSAPLFWYRRQGVSELSRANNNKTQAMKYVTETASKVADDIVEPIQYPRYGDNHATCKEYDLIVPDYNKDKRKTILYIFPWMAIGGADFFNLELIKRLPQDKFRAIVLLTTPNRNPLRQDFEDYAEVYDMSSFLDRIDYQTFTDYIISSRKVDLVVVSNTEYGYYMVPYLKAKHPETPFIDYIHSVDHADPRKGFGRCSRDVDQYLYGTYCCNSFTKKQLKEDFQKKKVDTVYIGTNEEKFNPTKFNKEELKEKYGLPRDKKIISFVARMSEEKRPLMFIEIAKRIYAKDSNTFFVMAGSGPLMSEVKAAVNDNFKLLGMINKTEEVYAVSDLTINCSSLEGLALTSYESLAMSVPVVSTDVGGQTELIDETVGGIVHYNKNCSKEVFQKEINQYVTETIRVLNDLPKIKKNCRNKILEGFTLDIMKNNMEKIFNEAISSNLKEEKYNIDTTTYELACESFNGLYYNYTNDYYETNLGVYLTATASKHQRLYRHIRTRLEGFGAVKEGKEIIEFIRSFKKTSIDVGKTFIKFCKAFVAGIRVLLKMLKRIITKPFRR
ncbi:MAG: glycosyltransferase [Bacilli bacterium]|nr:glycosyltransferase [Bacilli bacterium]